MGIPTVTLNLIPEIVNMVGIPRALNVRNPFGSPVGAPGNAAQQLRVLREALGMLVSANVPGTMLKSEEQYKQ